MIITIPASRDSEVQMPDVLQFRSRSIHVALYPRPGEFVHFDEIQVSKIESGNIQIAAVSSAGYPLAALQLTPEDAYRLEEALRELTSR